jgi:pyruvate dehydrogenase E2 component (dihydrolipoamide acetyltransferase)
MATKVYMEALSPTMEEGRLVTWLKDEGDEVAEGDVLAEVETDKATMELVARGSGVLRSRLIGDGDTANVGDLIGVIAAADEDIASLVGGQGGDGAGAAPASGGGNEEEEEEEEEEDKEEERGKEKGKERGKEKGKETEKEKEATSERRPARKQDGEGGEEPAPAGAEGGGAERGAAAADGGTAPPETGDREEDEVAPAAADGGRVKSSPLARRLAREGGIDLSSVQGSGPRGRIVRRDVEQATAAAPRAARAGAPEGAAPAPAAAPAGDARYREHPLSQMRRTIARRLAQSLGPVPHFFLTVEADMGEAVRLRERLNRRFEAEGVKVSPNDLVLKAVAMALKRHPFVNAAWTGDAIRLYEQVHIGVAVAVEEGLITPVVRDADRKGIAEIASEVRELAGRARERKLKPEEYTGSTFSVSNLGMFGIEEFTAVINPPEAAILAVGAIGPKVVVDEGGEVAVRQRMRMTLSCDHRVVDGATGAQFLQTLVGFLEDPLLMIA